MNRLNKILSAAILTVTALGTTVFGFNGAAAANASCLWQYDPSGNFTTSQTPVFNSICGVDNGVGNEPNFVRIRQSSNGNDEDNQNNPTYASNLTAACNTGDKFDIWTYDHNDAMSQFNNNGSGSAVAHDMSLAMSAPLNSANTNFTFGSTISASNADTVSASANLNCGNNVQLTLVPQSVHVYSQPYSWQDLPDSAVNGSTKLGSPTMGSGDQWGCWTYRIVVVYEVEITPVPPQTTTTTNVCTGETTNTNNGVGSQGGNCSINTTSVTTSSPPPTELVNTGAGSVAGIFAGTTALGAVAYRWLLGRRLSRQ